MSIIIRFGVDLAKNSFAICGVDKHDKVVFRKTLARSQLLEYFTNVPPAIVAMEAGSGAHHWARELIALGHKARIIDPRLVAPYRHQGRTGKNDINDAIAICEAAGRPAMRFVPVKNKTQQAILLVHRLRRGCVAEHTRTANRLRGFLAEFGIIAPKGVNTLKARWGTIRQQHDHDIPAFAWAVLDELYDDLRTLHRRVLAYDRQINAFVRDDPRAKRLTEVTGIGLPSPPRPLSPLLAMDATSETVASSRPGSDLHQDNTPPEGSQDLAESPSMGTVTSERCWSTARAAS